MSITDDDHEHDRILERKNLDDYELAHVAREYGFPNRSHLGYGKYVAIGAAKP